jgi:hypothetical protein
LPRTISSDTVLIGAPQGCDEPTQWPTRRTNEKLYCYVDETGQDTHGRLFLVAVVIVGEERETLAVELERIEAISGKRLSKWRKASFERKTAHMRSVLALPQLSGALYYARYSETKAYLDLMVYAAARAILHKGRAPYKATVIVDGLSGTDIRKFGTACGRYACPCERLGVSKTSVTRSCGSPTRSPASSAPESWRPS